MSPAGSSGTPPLASMTSREAVLSRPHVTSSLVMASRRHRAHAAASIAVA
jgi:hypothetical protein